VRIAAKWMSLRRPGPVPPVGQVGAGALSKCLDAPAETDYPSRWPYQTPRRWANNKTGG